MNLIHQGLIDLPANTKPDGFDHAAVHEAAGRLYVAHTCNDAVDVIDCINDSYVGSIDGLIGVAGALVSDADGLIFTSNRGENTVGIIPADDWSAVTRVGVGVKPNGLAFDPGRGLLLSAHVGDPAIPESFTVSLVDVAKAKLVADIPVPGRTCWTVYDPTTDAFYVNIMDPALIVVVKADDPPRVEREFTVPAAGPHGLDIDTAQGLLHCACDEGKLLTLETGSGSVVMEAGLAGVPDVIFINVARGHIYVAIGDPGVIEVFDAASLVRLETIRTEEGAHTLGFDATRNKVYAFLPKTHRAAVYVDGE